MNKNNKGFTLIELILVVALLGILGYTAIPAITSTQAFGLDNASRKLEADLRYAQNLSMTTGEEHGFKTITDEANTNYEIYNTNTGNPVASPYDRQDMTEDFNENYKGVFFKDDESYEITFDSQGNPTFVTGGQNIVLENLNGNSKTIYINSIGLIEII